jgi:lactate dehydrogenase-like 2-hydroxyacid dehydrogenase
MVKSEILYMGGYPEPLEAKLREEFALLPLWTSAGAPAEITPAMRRARVATGLNLLPFTRDMIERLPGLTGICKAGVGYETIDIAAARERGIVVTNTPDCTSDAVADMAIGLLLAVVRQILRGDRYVRKGQWREVSGYPLVDGLGGKRLGVLGLGNIGREVARRAAGFKLDIAYTSRRKREVPYAYFDDLVQLAEAVDYLVVAAPATPETRHIVDRRVLRALGPGGVLVNIARSALVDEAALIAALCDGTIAGAGLDVFENEPEVPEALRALDNVVLMPHRGGGDWQTWWRCFELACANARAILARRPPPTPVPETPPRRP